MKAFNKITLWIRKVFCGSLLFKAIILILVIMLNFFVNLNAMEHDIKFHHITIEDGLSQSAVNCILQDRKGFMWFGTEDGLNKYDGYNFIIFKPSLKDSNSLSTNNIRSIYEDRSGILWVGTYEGLNKYDREKEQFTRYLTDPDDPNSLSHNWIRAIFEDRLGNLWIGTSGGGLNKFDR